MNKTVSLRDFSLVLALLLIWGFFGWRSHGLFLGARNLSNLALELSITATLALGMLLVLLPGMIDLSVGSGVGLIGGIAAVLIYQHAWPAPLAMLVGFAFGVVVWALMGLLITRQKVPAFIITLGGLLVFKGVFWRVIGNATIPVTHDGAPNLLSNLTTTYLPPWVGYVGVFVAGGALAASRLWQRKNLRRYGFAVEEGEQAFLKVFLAFQCLLLFVVTLNQFRGIPLTVVLLAGVALAVQLLTLHTPFGRYLYAVGGNTEAAVLSGVPVGRVVVGAYMLLGVIVALTGYLQTAYIGASTTTVGELMELDAIAACVIGGTSLTGGRGTVAGALAGALIIASLLNGLTLLAAPPEVKFIARGLVLATAVWMDVYLSRRSGLKT